MELAIVRRSFGEFRYAKGVHRLRRGHGLGLLFDRCLVGYLCGINSESSSKALQLNLAELSVKGMGNLITDGTGGNLSFEQKSVTLGADKTLEVTLQPTGGAC